MQKVKIDQLSTQAYYLIGTALIAVCVFTAFVSAPAVGTDTVDVTPGEDVVTEAETSESINITVTDSSGQTATATTPIEIVDNSLARFDTDGEEGIQQGEALAAISAYNDDTLIGGEEVTQGDALEVITAYNTN